MKVLTEFTESLVPFISFSDEKVFTVATLTTVKMTVFTPPGEPRSVILPLIACYTLGLPLPDLSWCL